MIGKHLLCWQNVEIRLIFGRFRPTICQTPILNRFCCNINDEGENWVGFHFNEIAKYGTMILAVGSIKPYALFLIF